jgi:hypothetical protein
MLYQRDYRILTAEERIAYDKAKSIQKKKFGFSYNDLMKFHRTMPLAGYHYDSLFPNNLLCIAALDKKTPLEAKLDGLKQLLDNKEGEQKILNYINSQESHFIIGSMLKRGFDIGHHQTYVFKEFGLPPNFVADYLIVGKNSGGYEFVFVELESAYGQITTKDGGFGACIRAGLKQIEDWDEYIDGNFTNLNLLFQNAKQTGTHLPDEFYKLDKTRIHYAIIAGRRADFKDKTYRKQRKLREERKIHLLHYDSLLETTQRLLKDGNY